MPLQFSHALQLAAGIIGFCAYIPLTIGILRDTTRQSFAAFLLWALLDSIAMVSSIFQEGNFWLAASNVAGATFIAVLLLFKRQFEWTRTENITAVMVVACLVIWYYAGNMLAIVASSVAVVIAGIPQMVHTSRQPQATPMTVYFIWLTANILSFFAGRTWTIEERFYAACGIVLCCCILGLAWLSARQPQKKAAG